MNYAEIRLDADLRQGGWLLGCQFGLDGGRDRRIVQILAGRFSGHRLTAAEQGSGGHHYRKDDAQVTHGPFLLENFLMSNQRGPSKCRTG
jgi:hypothetical protein